MSKWKPFLESWAAPAWLLACVLLGGSSLGGMLANAALQIVSLAILVALLRRFRVRTLPRGADWLLTLAALAAVLMLLSLIPLPFELWRHLPGRSAIAAGYDALGMTAPSLPLTLQAEGTLGAFLSLCPPVAMFLLTLRASQQGRFATVIALAAVALVSIVFGVAQQVSGYGSDLYIYAITSRGGAVGFFANRNHLATLCLATMPFIAALAAPSREARAGQPLLMAGVLLFLVLGVLVVQSLAGWLLLVPTLVGCWLVYRRRSKVHRRAVAAAGLGLALVLLAALFTPAAPDSIGQISGEVTPRDRRAIMDTTWRAARAALPTGTGFGSFVQVYPSFENPALTDSRYVNHAHNDYLELLLEAGLPGLLLLAGFVVWWLRASRDAWQRRHAGAGAMRAASVAIAVILAHGMVDYPLRTTAIAAVMALAAGLLTVAEPLWPNRKRYGQSGAGAEAGYRIISLSERPSVTRTPPSSHI